ncbi:hypothetical protein DBV15_11775 [Temnothorax longispinosus]|uniref:C-Maf-inducing protein PH domain-containing protein n=1 Tax=Temnothorax longispinosus TaxID=300112 RepID=A0A4S2KPG9_9HYME|nr:hypothetical protein DBV15_11775 [Temnothorax longispinosus]
MRQGITSTSSPQLPSDQSEHGLVEVQSVWTRPGAARSCPNLERHSAGCFSASSSSSPRSRPSPAGPCFKLFEEGDVQVCYLNQIQTFLKKTLCSKFLRRWETHYLYFNDCCLFSKTLTGFLQQPVPYNRNSRRSEMCCLNQTRTFVKKILSGKFLRRWETHHLYLNDCCLSSKTLTGFLQQPVPYNSISEIRKRWETHHLYLNDCCLSSKTLTSFLQQHVPYSSMSEIWKYVVAKWDPAYKNCFSIVLPDGSLLLHDSNAYTRDRRSCPASFLDAERHIISISTTVAYSPRLTGFLQQPVPYSSTSEIRKFCISEESTELSVNCHSNDSSVRSLRISRLTSTSKVLL